MPDNTDDQDVNLLNDADNGTESQDDVNTNTSANDGAGDNNQEDIDAIDNIDELREKLKTIDSANKKLYNRLQEAKGLKLDKQTNKWVPKTQTKVVVKKETTNEDNGLSTQDAYTLIRANVPEEDVDIVQDYARLNNKTIKESLSAPLVKGMLAEREEERKTANATSIGGVRRSNTKPNANELLRNANEKGELPESDEEMENLVEARLNKKQGK